MAKPLQPLTIAAPGFLGVNTEESAIGMNPAYAQKADNCVVDKQGRVASRKGYTAVSTNGASVLGSSAGIEAIFEFTDYSGDVRVISAGNNKVFSGTTTLTDITPGGYTISANNWKIVTLADHVYMFQRGHEPLAGVDSSGSFVLDNISDMTHASGTPPQANEVLAAFGRLWAADLTGNKHTVYWSDSIAADNHGGLQWTGGSSGSLDLTTVWPTGYDEIVALTEHNGFLIIFGKNSIVIYEGATAPDTSAFALKDTIEGVGCIERDSVQATGNDILFLSNRGLMSLGRVVQEKSLPLRDVSKNVRTDLMSAVNGASNPVKSVYSPDDAFYLLTVRDSNLIFCFDVRTPLQDGSFRVTTWSGIEPLAYANKAAGGFYMGLSSGLVEYAGFLDGTSSYEMEYFSNPLDFGSPGVIKMLKKVNLLVEGGADAQCVLKWSYDYSENYKTQNFKFDSYNAGEFNVSEYNTTAEYAGGVNLNTKKTNATGSGTVVSFGVTATIDDTSFAIQKIDLLTMTGRLL